MNKILLLILILAAVASAQFKEKEDFDPRQRLINTDKSSGALLDMSKLSIDQTYSMGYSSSGKNSMMSGSYVAGLNYQITDPLKLSVQLGASYVPYTSFSLPSDQKTQVYLKSATLDYRPNDSFRMVIGLNHNPAGTNYHDPFGSHLGMFGRKSFSDELLDP